MMVSRASGLLFAAAATLVFAAAAFAQGQPKLSPGTIAVPPQGTVPYGYYACMENSAQVSPNHLVPIGDAEGCMNLFHYHPAEKPANASTGHACSDRCTAQYNICVAHSPEGGEDRGCAMADLKCQRPCP